METGPHTRGPSAIRPSGQAWYSHRTGARRGRPGVRYAKLDREANGCVLHSGHHKILCPWATRGRYQWWRPEGYLSQVHTQSVAFDRLLARLFRIDRPPWALEVAPLSNIERESLPPSTGVQARANCAGKWFSRSRWGGPACAAGSL